MNAGAGKAEEDAEFRGDPLRAWGAAVYATVVRVGFLDRCEVGARFWIDFPEFGAHDLKQAAFEAAFSHRWDLDIDMW